MAGIGPLERLLECLRCRDISINLDSLQRAFDTEYGLVMESWIDEHVNPETLLTKDELSLYTTLLQSGECEAIAESQDLSVVRCVDDCEIQASIEELKILTSSTVKRAEALRTQQAAIASFVGGNVQNLEARKTANKTRNDAWRSENVRIAAAVEELVQGLSHEISELESQLKAADTSSRVAASEVLRADDKLLTSLQKLADDLDLGKPRDGEIHLRIQELCTRLVKYTVEGVRARLDRVYLESIDDRLRTTEENATVDAEATVLREGLESLYSEILPVAQMSTEQQFLQPAVCTILAESVQSRNRSLAAIDYISRSLSCATERLQFFTSREEEYQGRRAITVALINAARTELEVPAPNSSARTLKTSSPARRKLHKINSPVRQRNIRRRSSGTSIDGDLDSEQQLLCNLGISIPMDEIYAIENFQDALIDRENKLNTQAKHLQDGIETTIASHIHDGHATWQLLKECLLLETPYNLSDGRTEGPVDDLEKEVEAVRMRLAEVGLESLIKKDVRKEELIERWAH